MNRRTALQRAALLLGGALSAPAVSGVLSGCQPADASGWEPAFLNAEQLKAVEAVVDRIIPATDTPGGFTGCAPLDEMGGKTWAT